MSYIQRVRAGWKKIQVEPGTQNKKFLRALDYIATPFRPSGTYLAGLRLRSWERQQTQFDRIMWANIGIKGLSFSENVQSKLEINNLAFFFGQTMVDFNGFPNVSEDVDDPKVQKVTKSIEFKGYRIDLEFNSWKAKKDFVCRHGEVNPEQQYQGSLYKGYTDVYLKVFEIATGKTIIQSDPLSSGGIYRLDLAGELVYFGNKAMIKKLLIDDRKKPAIFSVPNETKVRIGDKFRLVFVDNHSDIAYVEQDNTILETIVNGRKYTFAFDQLIKGVDRSTNERANVRFPGYSLRIFNDSGPNEFKFQFFARDIIRIQLEGQNVFIFAQPL